MGTMVVTVEHEKLHEFFIKLPLTGCVPTGRMRRVGKTSTGVPIRDVEIELPVAWRGSMSSSLYELPGVCLLTSTMYMGHMGRIEKFIHEFVQWRVFPSGSW